eukprot:TRINITY_DN13122_c1_g1_i1.p2 TRINITY_DN13122_c1_g1~~TRINITY_DN13122_c1_g1_i1.p2  ORF type:complete len:137 (-),score=8.61 TRINITY_DN13122_c1_g1_i1:163-573(-)
MCIRDRVEAVAELVPEPSSGTRLASIVGVVVGPSLPVNVCVRLVFGGAGTRLMMVSEQVRLLGWIEAVILLLMVKDEERVEGGSRLVLLLVGASVDVAVGTGAVCALVSVLEEVTVRGACTVGVSSGCSVRVAFCD